MAEMDDTERLARLRSICMALPDADERLSHGEPTWFAGKGKVFAMVDDHHHGSEHFSVWLPLPDGEQARLLAERPEDYFRPPYVGHRVWVGFVLDQNPDWSEVERLVKQAFLHVAGKRLVKRLLESEGLP